MGSIHRQIIDRIKTFSPGEIFFPDLFLDIGSTDSIRQALSRICKGGEIVRLAKGIYYYPFIDKELGILYPSIERVARAISQRDRSRIIPTGLFALNRLGLSTQVPMKVIFMTDGIPRKITIGKQTITFKQTSPKNLSMKGEITTLVIAALKEIGKENINTENIKKIKDSLKQEDEEAIIHDAHLAPEWIAKIMLNKTL